MLSTRSQMMLVGVVTLAILIVSLLSSHPIITGAGLAFSGASIEYMLYLSTGFPKPGQAAIHLLATLSTLVGLGGILYYGLKVL